MAARTTDLLIDLLTRRLKRRLDRMVRRGQTDRHIVARLTLAMLRAGLTADQAGVVMGGVVAYLKKSRRGGASWANASRPGRP